MSIGEWRKKIIGTPTTSLMTSLINLYTMVAPVAIKDDGGVKEFLVFGEKWLVNEVRRIWGKHRENNEEDDKECWFVEEMVIDWVTFVSWCGLQQPLQKEERTFSERQRIRGTKFTWRKWLRKRWRCIVKEKCQL